MILGFRFLRSLALTASLAFTPMVALSQYGRGGPPAWAGRERPPGMDGPGARGPARTDGKWWSDPAWSHRLNLSVEQQKRMEDVFQRSRLRLIDLRAALEKQEAILDPMISAEEPQESRVLAQIDRVAEARADLEKANARMLWGFRQVLTQEQWRALQTRNGPDSHGRE